jgi:hypothetical protein
MDDMTQAAMRRTARTQLQIQRDMRASGLNLAQVIASAMMGDIAIALIPVVGAGPTEALLHGADLLFRQHQAMTDLEWAAYENPTLDWAELAVKHLGPHLPDSDEARHVGLILMDVMWNMGDLVQTEGWVTNLVKQVSTIL